jgi:hypothetical protein
MTTPPPSRAAAGLVFELGLWTGAAYVLGLVVDAALDERWSPSSSAVALLVAATPLLGRRGSRRLGPDGGASAGLAMLCWLPLLVADAVTFARAPVEHSVWPTNHAGLAIRFSLWLVVLLLAKPIGAWLASRVRTGHARILARAAWIAMGCGAALLVLSLAGGARHAPAHVTGGLSELPLVGSAPRVHDRGRQVHQVGPMRVAVEYDEYWRFGIARPGGEEPQPSWVEQDEGNKQTIFLGALTLHRTARDRLWVLLEDGILVKGAFLDGSLLGTTLRVHHVGELLRAPYTTVAAAALGLIVAVVHLALHRRSAARAAALAAGTEAVVRPDGWLDLGSDQPPLRLPEPLPPGPVVLLGADPHHAAAYRGAHAKGALSARPGRKDWLLAEEEARAFDHAARALAAAALPLAGTATLAAFGLLG